MEYYRNSTVEDRFIFRINDLYSSMIPITRYYQDTFYRFKRWFNLIFDSPSKDRSGLMVLWNERLVMCPLRLCSKLEVKLSFYAIDILFRKLIQVSEFKIIRYKMCSLKSINGRFSRSGTYFQLFIQLGSKRLGT